MLFCPPFADEMHMSRHIVADTARLLAEQGYCVMLPDLFGCGDAPGDFADATWSGWQQDLRFALDHLRSSTAGPVVLWGLRAGCLLAADLAHQDAAVSSLVMWHPVLNGEQQVDQFLRLQSTASSLSGSDSFDRKALWAALRSGESLEVAGYTLAPQLALEMSEVRLATMAPGCPTHWLDVSPAATALPASQHVLERWGADGVSVSHQVLQGEPFWRTIDAPLNSDLAQCTRAALETSA